MSNPYLKEDGDHLVVTEEGHKYLSEIVTSPTSQVYAFNQNASPMMVAAAMARLSRRGSDLREIILEEFASTEEDKVEGLLRRVITAYGDDSVQQLAGLQFVVEDASNLLTKALEWGRPGSYLEQSTRYIFFDQQDAKGNFKYYTPPNLGELTADYNESIDTIFKLYSKMVRELAEYVRRKHPQGDEKRVAWMGATRAQACDAIRPVLPVATKSTVGIFGSAQMVDYLIMRLLGDDLVEFRAVGQQILEAARQVIGVFLERTDMPDRGGAITAYKATTKRNLRELAKAWLPEERTNAAEVILLDRWPKDELDLVPELLFEASDKPLDQIRAAVAGWTDDRREEVIRAYIGERLNRRHKPGRGIEKAHYEWQITADYGTFRDIQRHRMVDAFEWQRLTPYYGYEIPELVKEAGLATDFKLCFDVSHDLYWRLFAAGFEAEAQYATLLGNRMPYRFITNLRSLFHMVELRTQPAGHPGYRRIFQKMHRLVADVHPIFASLMMVNFEESPELTRMAAERATQFKLEQLTP